ncbi:hypothetical protein PT974_12454 [Cladobotryum mycophilum]|uniref:F-box domain-containing protein n=1 Tax=Cladobotryum mycophilum TaxID=491253 RepID=A0ABR0S957_9HYPO
MHHINIPLEILSLILRHLVEPRREAEPSSDQNLEHLKNARLVCRQWNQVAKAHLFGTVVLRHPTEEFEKWNEMLDNRVIKTLARRVIIHSAPDDLDDRDYEEWDLWEQGQYQQFTASINRISELKNIKSLHLHFSRRCWGVENTSTWDDDVEKMSTRQHTLTAVFNAIAQRVLKHDDVLLIRNLTIENLQNLPIPDIVSSDAFKRVIGNVRQLNLMIQEEQNEFGSDQDLYRIERQTFEPFLQRTLLPNFTHQLTSLKLYFKDCWGVAPGYFDGSGLDFIHLKTLTLGGFVIAHDDQFDWVLSQKALGYLRLDHCYIASHLCFCDNNAKIWKTPTHDWTRQPVGTFGYKEDTDTVYTYSGRWEAVYDNIRTRLLNLKEFCVHNSEFHDLLFNEPELMENNGISPYRYIVLENDLSPTPWIQLDRFMSGKMLYSDESIVDTAADAEEGDNRAFQELMQVVKRRGDMRLRW